MRRILTLGAVAALLAGPATASAASQTVAGTGDVTKMKVTNGDKGVKVALFGLGELCGGARQANVTIYWGKAGYVYDGGCPHGEWGGGLFYKADTGSQDATAATCPKLGARFAKGAVRITVPRSCMKKAADKVRVKAEGHNFGTMTGGEAGPTKLLKRG